jgi:hypothetical protein
VARWLIYSAAVSLLAEKTWRLHKFDVQERKRFRNPLKQEGREREGLAGSFESFGGTDE